MNVKLFAKTTLVTVGLLAVLASSVRASVLASDNASGYTTATWTNGANLGSGFGDWSLSFSGTGNNYIGATGQGPDPSFGLYTVTTGTATADRPFTGALSIGQTFTVDLGHTSVNNGEMGLNLLSGSTVEFTLKMISGQSFWKMNDGGSDFSIGQGFQANTSLHFTFTYNGTNDYSWTFGSDSGNHFYANSDITSINGVRLYDQNQGAGENFGFNNLAIIPEPSTLALVGLGLLGALAVRRRK